MVAPIEVDDVDDPRLADYRALTDADLRRRVEREAGVFVAEGRHAVAELLTSRYPVRSMLVLDRRLDALRDLVDACPGPVYAAPLDVLREITGFTVHRGLLAAADRLPPSDPHDVLAGDGPVLVLDGLNDNENLGSLFRNARALGAGGVVLLPGCADPLYRRSVRVSSGHVLHVPFAPLPAWPDAADVVHASGRVLVALTPARDAEPVDALRGGTRPLALLLGAEGPGLGPDALAAADRRVRIPMARGVDSLNVATAAAVALHAVGAVR